MYIFWRSASRPMLAILALLLLALPARGQDIRVCYDTEEHALYAGSYNDRFGASVTLGDGIAIVGSPYRNDRGPRSGCVFVFRDAGHAWALVQKIRASDERSGAEFGTSVSMSADSLIVGARAWSGNGNLSGAAYIFKDDGPSWREVAMVTPTNAAPYDRFGISVCLEGDVAIVGAPGTDSVEKLSGAAYVYRLTDHVWREEAILMPSDPTDSAFFGSSVAIEGDLAVIGARLDDDGGEYSGSAYIFRFDGTSWVEEQKLAASDAGPGHYFGDSVAVSSELVLVGAIEAASRRGAVYLYEQSEGTWTETQKLVATDGGSADHFGDSVAASDDFIIVGASRNTHAASFAGAAYVFTKEDDLWVKNQKLVAESADYSDAFGVSVDVSGDTALTGAWLADDGSHNHGAAYLHDLVAYRPCRHGTVDLGIWTTLADVLTINTSPGDCAGDLQLETGTPIEITMSTPLAGPNPAPFVLYAWRAIPQRTTRSPQPYGMGMMCFPSYMTIGVPKPLRVWNNAGHEPLLGAPDFPSMAAPSTILSLPSGLNQAATITLQGIIADNGSAAEVPASVTNAVILHIVD